MSANIKCYWDPECTEELFFETISYSMSLGLRTGLNGDTGEVMNQDVYLKNVGDELAQGTLIRETSDLNNYFKVSTPLAVYAETSAKIGDIAPDEVVLITFHSLIPRKTSAMSGLINFSIEYYTLPGADREGTPSTYVPSPPILKYPGDPIPEGSPAGRPYGHGPYGEPLYGQEGFIHKQTILDTYIPIAGLQATYIKATYKINARYNGTEASIEDIQSYYTSTYMALGCYDGPCLPLWLNTGDE